MSKGDGQSAQNEQVIRDFIAAWSRLDAAELAGYFAEDGCYYNMPMQPVKGRDKVEKFISQFLATWTATEWVILNIIASGNVVIAERLDKTKTIDGDVDLPCTGVFEMADGKIKEWRDYFDINTFVEATKG